MPRSAPALPLLLLCVLPSCASPGPPVIVRDKPPAQLLTCAAEPDPPSDSVLDAPGWDRALGLFIADLIAAGQDCRSKLGTLKGLLER